MRRDAIAKGGYADLRIQVRHVRTSVRTAGATIERIGAATCRRMPVVPGAESRAAAVVVCCQLGQHAAAAPQPGEKARPERSERATNRGGGNHRPPSPR